MAKNEIQKTESPQSPIERMAALVAHPDSKIDAAGMATLLDAQLKYEANEARKAYAEAMAAFKLDPPKILKDRTVGYQAKGGTVGYNHASLSNVTTCINTALSKHGLAASWVTGQDNGSVKVTCKITHVLGHSEETCLSALPDGSGSKNAIQAIGSTVTYLQRYTLLALTGLATYEDDDGKGSGERSPSVRPPTDEEWEIIAEVCKAIPAPPGKRVDFKKVAAICYEKEQSYPDMELVDRVVSWFAKFDRPEIFIDIPKDEFDEHVESFNSEHGEPDDRKLREVEETAKAKFGKETEQVPCRYECKKCDREFDEPTPSGKCPFCISANIKDRQES